jgi:hypothetical protein
VTSPLVLVCMRLGDHLLRARLPPPGPHSLSVEQVRYPMPSGVIRRKALSGLSEKGADQTFFNKENEGRWAGWGLGLAARQAPCGVCEESVRGEVRRAFLAPHHSVPCGVVPVCDLRPFVFLGKLCCVDTKGPSDGLIPTCPCD